MPIYEYQCEKCRAEYEQLEPSTAPRQQICIKMCGGLAKRVMSAPSIGHSSQSQSHITEIYSNNNDHLPQGIIKEIDKFAFETNSKYIAVTTQTIGDNVIGMATPIPDSIGKAIKKMEKIKRAAPNN